MLAVEIIARILGPFYIIVAIALFANPGGYREIVEDFLDLPALTYIGGLMALFFGLLILNFHSAWSADWRVLVTILGWMGFAKGAVLIIRPQAFAGLSQSMMGSDARIRVMAVLALVLGLYLAVNGYGLA